MDYSKDVPSRELCEEMQRLNICQDGAELYWYESYDPRGEGCFKWSLLQKNEKFLHHKSGIIAPTLHRMLVELPDGWSLVKNLDQWGCMNDLQNVCYWNDRAENSVALALIAIAKEK